MNYELHNPNPDPYREERKRQASADQDERDAAQLTEALRTIPQSRHDRHLIDELYGEHGAAFEIYLERLWTSDIDITNLEQDFLNNYCASYEQLNHFIDDQLDAIEILQPIKQALQGSEIADEALDWVRAGYYAATQDDYLYLERDGLIHVFYADTPTKGDE